MEAIFGGLFDTSATAVISVLDFLLCIGAALLIGLIFAACYAISARCTRSFGVTLALLPAVVCVVIMMVNGNVGAGVAVAGAFSLVRFRSVPGTAREIGMLFIAMGAGLIVGMGYIAFSLLFALIAAAAFVLYNKIGIGAVGSSERARTLGVTIPENLNYTDVFKDIFEKYTKSCELVKIKTTNLGSMFKLTYEVILRNPSEEREMIDEIRTRNGNLEVSLVASETAAEL